MCCTWYHLLLPPTSLSHYYFTTDHTSICVSHLLHPPLTICHALFTHLQTYLPAHYFWSSTYFLSPLQLKLWESACTLLSSRASCVSLSSTKHLLCHLFYILIYSHFLQYICTVKLIYTSNYLVTPQVSVQKEKIPAVYTEVASIGKDIQPWKSCESTTLWLISLLNSPKQVEHRQW